MTLQDEISTINYMIRKDQNATVGDYLKERAEMLADERWNLINELKNSRRPDNGGE